MYVYHDGGRNNDQSDSMNRNTKGVCLYSIEESGSG